MKLSVIYDKNREEEIIVVAHEKTKLIEDIEKMITLQNNMLIGFRENNIVPFDIEETICFQIEGNKLYAHLNDGKVMLKNRLYEIEEKLDGKYLKINQSCIVKVEQIKSFEASIAGALMVTLKNGYRDYVSRRQVKAVKERMGF